MKNRFYTLFLLLFFGTAFSAFCQNISFSGKDIKTNKSVKIDSIYVYDITLNKDTTIKNATSFDINSIILGIKENEISKNFELKIKNNLINSSNINTTFTIQNESPGNFTISLFNQLGEKISEFSNYFETGIQSFMLQGNQLPIGIYFLNVTNNLTNTTVKLINLQQGTSNKCEIHFLGSQVTPKVKMAGDEFNFTGYSNGYEPSNINNVTPEGGEDYSFDFTPKESGPFTKNHIIPLLYRHVKDSDGSTFAAGTDGVFCFEPNNIMHLYVGSDKEAASVAGEYSIENNKLHIVITDEYFPVDKIFPADTSAKTITMPFKVFSEGQGTSTWEKVRLEPEALMLFFFKAIALDETGQTTKDIETRIEDLGNSIKDNDPESGIITVSVIMPSMTIVYDKKEQSKLMFYSKNRKTETKTLKIGALASDPRTHLNCESPKNNEFDPMEKTALLFGPFDKFSFPAWIEDASGKWSINYDEMEQTFGQFDSLDVMKKKLQDIGYSTVVLRASQAGVIELIDNLLPGNGRATSPGMIYLSTHGFADGTIATGNWWINQPDYDLLIQKIKDAYPDLLTYNNPKGDISKMFSVVSMPMGWRMDKNVKALFIKPLFWEWLRNKGADFSRSFVHIGACLTDQNPELRETIKAKAIFQYHIEVPANFCAAVQYYTIELLSRPSTSTEEVFYNIKRLAYREEMIYKEDILLKGLFPTDMVKDNYMPYAYGYDGSETISYDDAGWRNTENLNQGDVWYLLWAARWGQNVQEGWQALLDCWNWCWKDGKAGGLAYPGCNNMSPGGAPFDVEVAYAGYLLKGELTISPSGQIKLVPRFTLKDGE